MGTVSERAERTGEENLCLRSEENETPHIPGGRQVGSCHKGIQMNASVVFRLSDRRKC